MDSLRLTCELFYLFWPAEDLSVATPIPIVPGPSSSARERSVVDSREWGRRRFLSRCCSESERLCPCLAFFVEQSRDEGEFPRSERDEEERGVGGTD